MQPDEPSRADRVAIVTGGSCGAGREVTRTLSSRGYAVVLSYLRNQGAADAAVEEVLAGYGTALAVRADVADECDVQRLFSETTVAFGGVDVVVHAAGQIVIGRVADHDRDAFVAVRRANAHGMFIVNRQASHEVRDGGAIVNLSGSVVVGLALPTSAAVAASRTMVEAITRAFARELRGRDITVNAVVGGLETPGALGAIADVVGYLVSGDGRNLSGHVIRIDRATVW